MRWVVAAAALVLAALPGANAEPSSGTTLTQQPPPPAAPAPQAAVPGRSTQARVSDLAAWSLALQSLLTKTLQPFQQMPPPPSEDMNDRARHEWAERARAWSQQAQATLADARLDLDRLPPSPPADAPVTPEMRASLEHTRAGAANVIAAAADIAQSYGPMADAFERRQTDAVRQIRIRVVDSSLLAVNLFHDANISQALAVPPSSPQFSLLMSYARSYEGFAALLTFKRSVGVTGARDMALATQAATALLTSERQVRLLAEAGRVAAHTMQQQYADVSQAAPENAALLGRLQIALRTFDASFDIELRGADEEHAIAGLLTDPRDFNTVEPEIDAHMDRLSELDQQRVADARNRMQILGGQ
ncbi:MAG: hypothetical protein QM759_14835 [Terricaulis sp.]